MGVQHDTKFRGLVQNLNLNNQKIYVRTVFVPRQHTKFMYIMLKQPMYTIVKPQRLVTVRTILTL